MNKTSEEIKCLSRLDSLIASYDAVMDFLLEEKLISKDEIKSYRSSADVAKVLHTHLALLSKDSKLQLLEYSWEILPVERIKLLVVTDRAQREFSFGY